LAQLGFVAAVVGIGVYAVNQAVDGIAIKFVAEEWANNDPQVDLSAKGLAYVFRDERIELEFRG